MLGGYQEFFYILFGYHLGYLRISLISYLALWYPKVMLDMKILIFEMNIGFKLRLGYHVRNCYVSNSSLDWDIMLGISYVSN
jgi:hypothetical protein